jgi:hypothetical protein
MLTSEASLIYERSDELVSGAMQLHAKLFVVLRFSQVLITVKPLTYSANSPIGEHTEFNTVALIAERARKPKIPSLPKLFKFE